MVVKIIGSALLFFCTLMYSYAQSHTAGDVLYCWAKKGLNIRSEPAPDAKIIGKIAYKQSCIFGEVSGPAYTDTLQKGELPLLVEDRWIQVQSGNLSGYVFGGYLSARPVSGLYDLFGSPDNQPRRDTVIKGQPAHYLRLYAKDKSTLTSINSDGCEEDVFEIKNISRNEAILLLRETFPEESADLCPFGLKMISRDTWYFQACEATTERSIHIEKGRVRITLVSCD
ncbi:MAG: SH3 domain-containing protein [Bacteroidia bacterium]|nr:SH3 domain-containing protein [Bacteroidia bacterium]